MVPLGWMALKITFLRSGCVGAVVVSLVVDINSIPPVLTQTMGLGDHFRGKLAKNFHSLYNLLVGWGGKIHAEGLAGCGFIGEEGAAHTTQTLR